MSSEAIAKHPVESATALSNTAPASPTSAVSGAFHTALERLGARLDQGERLVRQVTEGGVPGKLEPSQLIALQAGVYRYTETVDLAAKLVDRAAQAVRTTLQSNQ